MTIIIFLAVLSLLVLFHECGHFFMARLFGCKVEEFGFGFPPKVWSKKHRGTLYSINWIPLGGFVRLKGENGEERNDLDSFSSKKMWQRAAILAAGVFMNLVLAFILFWIGYVAGFPTFLSGSEAPGDIRDRAVIVQAVLPESPAAKAGIVVGEKLLAVNGVAISSYGEFLKQIDTKAATELAVRVKAGNEIKDFKITTAFLAASNKFGLGLGLADVGVLSHGPFQAIVEAGRTTYEATVGTFVGFGQLIKRLVLRQGGSEAVSGPVGIAVLTGEMARLGWTHLVQFVAILSINLAVVNILPIPALDGGRLLFVVIERFRGRAVSMRVEGVVHTVGFLLLMLLVVFITYRDFVRYGGYIWGGLKSVVGL